MRRTRATVSRAVSTSSSPIRPSARTWGATGRSARREPPSLAVVPQEKGPPPEAGGRAVERGAEAGSELDAGPDHEHRLVLLLQRGRSPPLLRPLHAVPSAPPRGDRRPPSAGCAGHRGRGRRPPSLPSRSRRTCTSSPRRRSCRTRTRPPPGSSSDRSTPWAARAPLPPPRRSSRGSTRRCNHWGRRRREGRHLRARSRRSSRGAQRRTSSRTPSSAPGPPRRFRAPRPLRTRPCPWPRLRRG